MQLSKPSISPFYYFQQDMDPEEGKAFSSLPDEVTEETVVSLDDVKTYKQAIEDLHNTGENEETLDKYKQSVINMLKMQASSPPP